MSSFFISCEKDNHKNPPFIELMKNDYVYQDSMLRVNQKIKVGFEVSGEEVLTYLGVKMEADGQVFYLLDSGMYCNSFHYERTISKGAANVERWIFTVMDKKRNISSVTLVFTRDPSSGFGQINYHPSLYLGAQDNPDYHHFLSLPSGITYNADSATAHQDLTDILFYYNPGGAVPPYECTFSSPGENDAPGFYPFLNSWVHHNSTYYNLSTSVSAPEFENCVNDSLLLAAYDESNGKRKFKNAAAGNIIPFKTQAGKKGLMRVKNIASGSSGWVEVEVKVQE